MNETSFQTSLRDLATMLFRRRRSVSILLAAAMLSAIVSLYLLREDTYEVSAKLLVKIGREQAAPTTMLDERAVFIGDRTQDVNSETDILHNRELLAKVVDQLRLDQPTPPQPAPRQPLAWTRYQIRRAARTVRSWIGEAMIAVGLRERLSPRAQAIAGLDRSLRVTRQRDSNVLVATLNLPVRQGAARVLNTLLDDYESFRLDVFQDRSAVAFFQSRVEESQQRLSQMESELHRVEQAGGIRAIADQKRTLVEQLADTQNAVDASSLSLREATGRVARLKTQLTKDDPDFSVVGSFPEGSYPEKLVLELSTLQREREQLRTSELDSGPHIQSNRRQFQLVIGLLKSNLQASLTERQAEYESRKQTHARFQTQLDSLQSEEQRWTDLKRSAGALEDSYLFFRKKLEEALATNALRQDRIGNVSIIEHATDPIRPAGRPRLVLLGVTFVIALLGALAWVVVAEFFDHRVYTAEALESRLGAPVVAVVPAGPEPRGGRGRHSNAAPVGPSATLGEEAVESYRRAALFLARAAKTRRQRAFLFTSSSAGEGTTTAVLQIARELHETCGLRPLVVELNRRHPTCAAAFGLDPRRTVEAVAHGGLAVREAIQQNASGVSIIPAAPEGTSGPGDQELAAALRSILSETEGTFDVVLLDTSAVLEGADFLIAGAAGPQVLLVVESGRVRYEVLERVKRDLSVEGMGITAGVLTKQRRVVPEWLYRWLVA